MLRQVNVSGLLLFLVSLGILSLVVMYFFILPREFFFTEVIRAERIPSILLEGAEVSRVAEKGKEWALKAERIEKKDGEIWLFSVSGTFFDDGTPLYEVSAQKGKILLEESSVWLSQVRLVHTISRENILGEDLFWLGDKKEFVMQKVSFVGREMEAEGKELIYNVAQRKAYFRGDVVLRLRMGGR
ncbi:MAG: LPS export ABC transporter periplasmic protein LptC [Candidatus Caldatribacteriaceae bacterium]